jgi:hypothetical protein
MFTGCRINNNNTLFRDSEKIINITNTVTQAVTVFVTKLIKDNHELFDNLYDDTGVSVKNILTAFASGSEELATLLDYDNYAELADNFKYHLEKADKEDSEVLENFVKLLIDAVQGVKTSLNKIKEQEHAYKKLLDAYNKLSSGGTSGPLLSAAADLDTLAIIKPEILEYIKRGYKIVDDDGNILPLDMEILAEIRKDLDI